MRKMLVAFALLMAFVRGSVTYGIDEVRVLVYKGTIQASNSIFDANNPTRLHSDSIKGCWAVAVYDLGVDKGSVADSNAVIYDTREKYYKVIPDAVTIDPCDPCDVVMLNFNPADADGQMKLYAVGEGKLTKFSNRAGVAKDFVPVTLKGTGLFYKFDVFDPNETYSGPVTVTLTLDAARTRAANPDIYTPNQIIKDVVSELTSKGGWVNWPYVPAP